MLTFPTTFSLIIDSRSFRRLLDRLPELTCHPVGVTVSATGSHTARRTHAAALQCLYVMRSIPGDIIWTTPPPAWCLTSQGCANMEAGFHSLTSALLRQNTDFAVPSRRHHRARLSQVRYLNRKKTLTSPLKSARWWRSCLRVRNH